MLSYHSAFRWKLTQWSHVNARLNNIPGNNHKPATVPEREVDKNKSRQLTKSKKQTQWSQKMHQREKQKRKPQKL